MNTARDIRNLALVGFMGTGKSSIGRLLAESLQFEFVDTDDLIEQQSGHTIEQIFKDQGEPAFRELESLVVEQLGQRNRTVIATGGGLVINPANLVSLKRHALVVCLWASPETIWARVRNQTHRPLLQAADPLERIRTLFAQRDPAYRQADVLLQTNNRSTREVAQQAMVQFQAARR